MTLIMRYFYDTSELLSGILLENEEQILAHLSKHRLDLKMIPNLLSKAPEAIEAFGPFVDSMFLIDISGNVAVTVDPDFSELKDVSLESSLTKPAAEVSINVRKAEGVDLFTKDLQSLSVASGSKLNSIFLRRTGNVDDTLTATKPTLRK